MKSKSLATRDISTLPKLEAIPPMKARKKRKPVYILTRPSTGEVVCLSRNLDIVVATRDGQYESTGEQLLFTATHLQKDADLEGPVMSRFCHTAD